MSVTASRWGSADEIVAHGLGVKLDAAEMERLMHCTCQPSLLGGWCAICGRQRATESFMIAAKRFEPYEGTL